MSIHPSKHEIGLDCLHALHKELDGLGPSHLLEGDIVIHVRHIQGQNRIFMLTRDMERSPARCQNSQGWAVPQKVCNDRCSRKEVLKIVEDNEDVSSRQCRPYLQIQRWSTCLDTECLGNRREDEGWISEGCKWNEDHTVGKRLTDPMRDLNGQSRLSNPTGARQCQQGHIGSGQ